MRRSVRYAFVVHLPFIGPEPFRRAICCTIKKALFHSLPA